MKKFIFLMFFISFSCHGAKDDFTIVSAKALAYAPNAGGQDAYTLAVAKSDKEYFAFMNRSLKAGSIPLIGAGMDWRFPICDDSCFWQFYAQVGGGITTAGPMLEVIWGTMIPLLPLWLPTSAPRYVPAIRIDFANQMFFTTHRMITWSVPLWLGISIPF